MINDFHTEVWYGNIQFHRFSADNWFGLGGPTHPIFKTLVTRINNEVPYLDEFELFAIGGILEDWISWDVDLALIGEYRPDKIKTIFEKICEIGFDLHIFVDTHYQSKLWRVDEYSMGNDIEEEIECWHITNSFTRDGNTTIYDNFEYVDGLYKTTIKYPMQKHIEKVNQGYVYHPPIKLN